MYLITAHFKTCFCYITGLLAPPLLPISSPPITIPLTPPLHTCNSLHAWKTETISYGNLPEVCISTWSATDAMSRKSIINRRIIEILPKQNWVFLTIDNHFIISVIYEIKFLRQGRFENLQFVWIINLWSQWLLGYRWRYSAAKPSFATEAPANGQTLGSVSCFHHLLLVSCTPGMVIGRRLRHHTKHCNS